MKPLHQTSNTKRYLCISFINCVLILSIFVIAILTVHYYGNKKEIYKNFEMIPNVSLISFNPKKPESYAEYIKVLDEFISKYEIDYAPKDNRIYCGSEKDTEKDNEVMKNTDRMRTCCNRKFTQSLYLGLYHATSDL